MLLALDVGNTNIVIGFLDASGIRNIARLETDRDKTAHEYAISLRQVIEFSGIAPEDVDGAILSSVVPPINGALVAARAHDHGHPPARRRPRHEDRG